MPLSPQLASWLSDQQHDAVHASRIGFATSPDEEIFEYAINEERIIITADLDYTRLLAYSRLSRPGLILFRGGNYSETELLNLLKLVLSSVSMKELENSIVVVDSKRIRKRKLPIEN